MHAIYIYIYFICVPGVDGLGGHKMRYLVRSGPGFPPLTPLTSLLASPSNPSHIPRGRVYPCRVKGRGVINMADHVPL